MCGPVLSHDHDMVRISVPATPSSGATLRIVASAISSDAGWGVDDIDDLKLAITETLSIVSEREGVTRLSVGFRVHDDEVTLHVAVEPAIALFPPDGLGAVILGAAMDHVDWTPLGATLRKRRSDPPAEIEPSAVAPPIVDDPT